METFTKIGSWFKLVLAAVFSMIWCQRGFAALTGTKVVNTEFSGDYKAFIKTVVPESASDTLTLVEATDKIREIVGVFPVIEAGMDAALTGVQISFSGLVITITTFEQDGTPATDWTSAKLRLLIIGR